MQNEYEVTIWTESHLDEVSSVNGKYKYKVTAEDEYHAVALATIRWKEAIGKPIRVEVHKV